MPGSSPPSGRTFSDWLAVWRYRLGEADFSTASKNFFHPGNVLALAFIALIIGFGIQGSVAAGVLSASVLTAAAPWLLIICSLLALTFFLLTITWGIYRFWGDHDEVRKQFKKLQPEEPLEEAPSAAMDLRASKQDTKKTNADIKVDWRKAEGGRDFIETLKVLGLDILNTKKFPDNVAPKGKIVEKHDGYLDSDNEEDHEEDAGLPENGPAAQRYIPSRVKTFLEQKQFSYWNYIKFLVREWFAANYTELMVLALLMTLAVILMACYFAGVASFMAPVFSTIVGFFDTAFAGLGMGGVALSHAHVAAMALAGIAFCFGSMNLTVTLRRAWRIGDNFFDGLLTEPPTGFAEQEKERQRPEVIGNPDNTNIQTPNLRSSSPVSSTPTATATATHQNDNGGNLPGNKPG